MPSNLKCFWGILVILALVPGAYSQDVRASITGQIVDPTGAAVAGASVSVTNIATNTVISAKSNETGTFATPFLAPGRYELTVESSGFKKFVRQNIILQAQDRLRLDVQMEVGEVSTSVTVSGEVSQLQTETASRSQVLASEIISNVPTQGRNPFQIAWAAAGVIKGTGWRYLRSFDIAGTTSITINGGRQGQNEVLLDGISNVRAEWTVISVPTPESIQEFKVQSATYDAQYGRTTGGVITIVTKGGGNDFHGTAFEYFQNDKLNANQTELNQPLTLAGQFYPKGIKAPNHINHFGAMASGPFYIPKVVNTRNRAFWMVSWESMRQRSADPGVKTFPIMDIRGGDFTKLFNANGQQVQIYDPYSTLANGSRTPIVGNKIPTSQLDPVAVKLLSYYPAPTSTGVGPAQANNNPYPSLWKCSFDQFVGRTDVVINSKNNFFFRYNDNPFQQFRDITFGLTNPAEPSGSLLRNGRSVTMNWTSTVSPTMTFDLRAGLTRWEDAGGNVIGRGYDPRQLGIDPNLVAQFQAYNFPTINIQDYQSMSSSLFNPGIRDTYSLQPNVNLVVGRHFLKFGVEGRRYNRGNSGGGYPSGVWTFNKDWTQANATRADAVSGNGLATMLMGIPSAAYVQKTIDPYHSHNYYAGFFQDDWKINSRLTMNVGLRWDTETGNYERFNRMVNGLDWNATSPIASQVTGLTLKGAVLFAGVGGQPRTLIDADKNNWQPRVGLAYRVGEKWVLRGGYGLYYSGEDALGSTNGFSRQTNAIVSSDGLTPIAGMKTANPYVALPGGKLLDPIGTSKGASSFLGEAVAGFDRTRAMPYSHQYSFDIQRELGGNILVEVGYTGNTARSLPVSFSLNYMPLNEYARRTSTGAIDTTYYTAKVPNPMKGLIPNNASLNGATISRPILWYAYPQYSGVTIASVPVGRAQYHGMNVKFTKRMSHGLSFLSSFSIGKNLIMNRTLNPPDFGGLSNWENTKLVKESDQNVDIPQKFVIAGLYELPFGKGKPLAGDVPGIVNQIIGGWQLNWDVTYQSGNVSNYPNAMQNAPGSAKLDNPTRTQWFNTALWKKSDGTPVATMEPYTLRNFPLLFSDVRRPGYQNWDASVSKLFPIREKVNLQFRFEMVNMMNHPFLQNIASVDVTNALFGRLSPNQANMPRFIKLAMHLNW
jgi:outer membrane receptor protein involved in Fe transport